MTASTLMDHDRLAALGELAAGAAHDINNSIFAILGLTEFLLFDAEPGTKAHERLLLIQQSGVEIKDIVKTMHDYARESAEDEQTTFVRDAIAEAVELARRSGASRRVEIIEDYEGEPVPAVASSSRITQLFLSTIGGACEAMRDGGTIMVAVRLEGEWIEASLLQAPEGATLRLRLPVAD